MVASIFYLITSKNRDSLDDPERRDATDGIRRNAPCPRGLRHADALHDLPRERNDAEDGRDEEQLSYLDANVEEEHRRESLIAATRLRLVPKPKPCSKRKVNATIHVRATSSALGAINAVVSMPLPRARS